MLLKQTRHPDKAPEPLTATEYAETVDSDLQGCWQGTLGGEFANLKLTWKIAEYPNASCRAELDNPDQGFLGQLVAVEYSRPDVKLMVMSGDGSFAGKLSSDRQELIGNWQKTGRSTPVKFRRINPQATTRQPEGNHLYTRDDQLQGHWKAAIPVNGGTLSANLDIAELPDGNFAAQLSSLDFGLPGETAANTVRYSAPKVFLEWKSFRTTFTGALKNGKLIGQLSGSGMTLPVSLERTHTQPLKNHHSITAAPHVSPAPHTTSNTRSPL